MSQKVCFQGKNRNDGATMWQEFKKFALKGNTLDLAIGLVIGAAFGKIVDSLVKDIIMPPLGMLLGRVDFDNLFVLLSEGHKVPGPYHTLADARDAGAVTINIGLFINTVVSFFIIAFSVFIVIRAVNKLRDEVGAVQPGAITTKTCPYCCSIINMLAVRCPECTSEL